jgi:hypothetical protein
MRLLRPAAVLGLLVSFAFAGVAQASVPNPLVQGPIEGGVRGYPWNHSLFALMGPGYAYTENEYFFGGTATDLTTGRARRTRAGCWCASRAIRRSSAAR